MKKNVANQIAKLWNEQFAGITEETRTKAVVVEGRTKSDCSVEIYPDGANVGRSFHHNEELTDVGRTFKVSGYVTIDDGKLIGRLF